MSSWHATNRKRGRVYAIDPTPFLYLLLTLAMTWPLSAGLTTDVPGDLGDSLLNMWILGWGAENIPRVLSGRISLHAFWDANIFHPEPLALAFSEHLFGQALQILPIYQLTGNLILAYNLLFLSSFVLSGWGMYLLVRDLLGDSRGFSRAAFIAGLIYAFVPFRIAQVAHIQSLSSQWMPFALYGLRRFIAPSHTRPAALSPLVGGTAALLMQNWSCGYYLIFFSPFVVLFVLHQVLAAGRARDVRLWLSLAAAAVVVAAGTWPFLSLYLEAQRVHGFERASGEVIRFSADVYSYFTAPEALRLWGHAMQAYPKPEGELFFGVVPSLLLLLALVLRSTRPNTAPTTVAGRTAARILLTIILMQLAGLVGILFTGGFVTSFAGIPIRATNPLRLLIGLALAGVSLLVMSRDARHRARAVAQSPLALAVSLLVLAIWLSLGPLPQSYGRTLPGLGLYSVFYEHVPGFDGLRVPARYAMVAALFLSIAAGYGAFRVLRRVTRPGLTAVCLSAAFVAEATFAPMLVNQTWGDGGLPPPARVEPAASAPAVYHELAALDDARVVAEFPFGDPAWELRYVYYSTVHWKRLVNGYSGGFPQSYKVRVARFQRIPEDGDAAWQTFVAAGATHAIVHEDAYQPGAAEAVTAWLTAHGAREVGRFGTDVLFAR